MGEVAVDPTVGAMGDATEVGVGIILGRPEIGSGETGCAESECRQ